MPDIPEERTYKHQVSADFVVEAITTLEWSEEQTKKFNEKGVYRLNEVELKQKFPKFESLKGVEGEPSTILYEIEVKEIAIFKDNKKTIPDVFIIDCSLAKLIIRNCQWIREQSKFIGNTNFIIDNSITGGFDIHNSTTGDFHINNGTTGDFWISDNSTTGDFWIFDNSNTGEFDIDNSTTGVFRIGESTTGAFRIGESTTGDFRIGESTTDFFFIHNSTTGDFRMENSTSPLWLIEDVQAFFYFSKAAIGQCQLNNCDIAKLTLKNECDMELYISGGTVNLIDFSQLSLGKNTILSFSKIALYACNMSEFSALGNLYFRDIQKAETPYSYIDIEKYLGDEPINKKLKLKYQAKKGFLLEHNIKYKKELQQWQKQLGISKPTFRIVQSSLSKTEFTECDLAAFRFEYNNSKLTDTFISGGTLPKNVEIYEETNEVIINDQRKAFFSQLKKVFDNQGDIVRSVFYRAKAAEIQFEILNSKERKLLNSEWWVYFLNKYSNYFGQSWGRALTFILLSSSIIFTFYLLAAGTMSLNPYTTKWDWGLVGQLFTFLNPTHRLTFIESAGFNINYGFWSSFWDFFGRVIISYGIYQFISAFRKHGKKA